MTEASAWPPYPPVVFVDGDNPTLVAEAIRTIVDDLVGSRNRELIVEDYGGDEVDLAIVVDHCATLPFLADRRIVVVRDAGRFSIQEAAPLLAYLENPLPTTILVLGAGGGSVAPRLVAAAKARGRIVSTKVTPRESRDWVRTRMRKAPVRVDAEAAAMIESHLAHDINRLGALLEVLTAAYGDGAVLGAADVEPYLGEAGSVMPWDLTDAIDGGQTQVALTSLHRLLGAGGRHPLVVLAILHRHVESMLRVDDPGIHTEMQAAAAMGIGAGRSTYPAKKALASARRWGSSGIDEAIGRIADAELELKGAGGCPEELVLEVLVARLCRLARTSARAGPARRPR